MAIRTNRDESLYLLKVNKSDEESLKPVLVPTIMILQFLPGVGLKDGHI